MIRIQFLNGDVKQSQTKKDHDAACWCWKSQLLHVWDMTPLPALWDMYYYAFKCTPANLQTFSFASEDDRVSVAAGVVLHETF